MLRIYVTVFYVTCWYSICSKAASMFSVKLLTRAAKIDSNSFQCIDLLVNLFATPVLRSRCFPHYLSCRPVVLYGDPEKFYIAIFLTLCSPCLPPSLA